MREQLDELTGRAPRNGASDDSRYKELLNSGISYAKEYGLRPGISLSAEQVAHLTSDIVWLESRNVVLPDGSSETVLVPKVYLAHAGAGAVKAGGALVTGEGVEIETTEGGIVNRGGLIDGANGRTVLTSAGDLLNQGGAVRGNALELTAGGDIVNQTLSIKQEYGGARPGSVISGSFTSLSNQASIVATGALTLAAGRDVADTAGAIRAGAGASVAAGRDIAFNTVQTGGSSEWKASGFTGSSSGVNHQASQLNSSGDLTMTAGRDLALSGTQAAAGGKGALEAGRALSVAAVKNESRLDVSNDARSKTYDKTIVHNETVAGAAVSAGGDLSLKAGTKETGALSLVASGVAGGGKVELRATGDVAITQLQEEHLLDTASHREWKSTFKKGSSDSADYSASSHVVGSSVAGAGVAVHSGGDIAVTASQLTATDALVLAAGRDLLIASAEQSGSERHSSQVKQSGFSLNLSTGIGYSKSQDDKSGNGDTVRQIGSVLSGGSIAATSGRDTVVKASTVVADGKLSINAKGDLSIVSAADRDTGDYATSSKKSGTIGSNFQPAVGTVKTTTDGRHANSTQVGSQIASLGGDVELTAGGRYTQTASQVKAPGGDIAITAKDVLVNAGYSTTDSTDHTTYAKTAIGGTVSVPLIDAIKGVKGTLDAGKSTKDSRMQALAAVNLAASSAALAKAAKEFSNGMSTGIKVSVSLGNSKSESNSVQSAAVAVGSTIAAGGSVTIKATGGGKDSNITAIGSDISAGEDVTLNAGNQVNLLAAESTVSQHSTNSSSGASIGIGFAFGGQQNGMTFDFAASKARGNADGDDLSHSNTHVAGGGVVTVTSGGDTNVKGGVIAGDSVVADIGGNLNIESLQDSSKYKSKQVSAGVGITVCVPPVCYGNSSVSGSFSNSKVEGDFLSVIEQSGIKAGDGGFDLTVKGNTDLKGAVLGSDQVAIAEGVNSLVTGSLTTSDLQNKDHHDASGFSVSGSFSSKIGDQTTAQSDADKKAANEKKNPGGHGGGAGFGSASGSQQSVTLAGVSDAFIDITNEARQRELTGRTVEQQLALLNRDVSSDKDAANSLGKGWDAKALDKEVNAQMSITAAFSQLAAKEVGDYAVKQKNDALALGDKAEAAKWAEGGAYHVLAHAVIGALAGGVNGAAGAGVSAWTAPQVDEYIKGLDLPDAVRKVVILAASTGLAGMVGGDAGAVSGYDQVVNNYLKHDEINSLLKAQKGCKSGKGSASDCAEVKRLETLDKQREVALSNCDGDSSARCVAVRQEVRSAYADIIRKYDSSVDPKSNSFFWYDEQMWKTRRAADSTISSLDRTKGGLIGLKDGVIGGLVGLMDGVVITFKAEFGDEQAQAKIDKAIDGVIKVASSPSLWIKIISNARAESREELAAAYEKGDGFALGKIAGEVLSNFVGDGIGSIGKAGKVAAILEDASKVSKNIARSVDAALLVELAENGVKFTADRVVATGRNSAGKVVFLELGDSSAGLQHILERHALNFADKGILSSEIPSVVMKAVTEGKIVGVNGSAPVFEIVHNGIVQHISVGVGSNGFIVRANPVSKWKPI
ncbi:hemagglutinin repeat-containing protein [Rugamonas sp. DEMB1]|uniref:hemagglutinin repeat-containing protein n=1 Tax=Rugamonas sp. DEMB1 TaxID=3039386 RepID=UPI00244BAD96|nr:hemagglutinin repeat-containing protein [Rugamonas sp. DEMB1]WGG52757.1 hemagglutinin repeat-containing protein [Rugamonas sp. DEMB1]